MIISLDFSQHLPLNDVIQRFFPGPAHFKFQQWQPFGCNSAFIYYIFRPCYCSNASYTMLKMYIIVAQIEHMVSFHCS